jgi:hypothetical protein
MANFEEMLEGYEWASDDILGRTRSKGAVDQIAARLQDELVALENVLHSTMACNGNNEIVFPHRRTFIRSSRLMIV